MSQKLTNYFLVTTNNGIFAHYARAKNHKIFL